MGGRASDRATDTGSERDTDPDTPTHTHARVHTHTQSCSGSSSLAVGVDRRHTNTHTNVEIEGKNRCCLFGISIKRVHDAGGETRAVCFQDIDHRLRREKSLFTG